MNRHHQELMQQGFVAVTREGITLPDGYAILAQGNMYVAYSPEGSRSGFCGSYESAHGWVQHHAFSQSGMCPEVGELWNYAGRTAIICGNSVSEQKTIWVKDWNSGDRANAPVSELGLREDRKTLTEETIVSRFSEWARAGNSDAIWWLAWWFEGTNHPKSVWYYVAALRADPKAYGWARERIIDDARTPCLCKDIPTPEMAFLKDIPEIQGRAIGTDWAEAVAKAEQSVHVPAKKTRNTSGPRVVKAAYTAPGDARSG